GPGNFLLTHSCHSLMHRRGSVYRAYATTLVSTTSTISVPAAAASLYTACGRKPKVLLFWFPSAIAPSMNSWSSGPSITRRGLTDATFPISAVWPYGHAEATSGGHDLLSFG